MCPPYKFQTQLLKLYFLTTLYVDVKEPAIHVHFRAQKNSILRPGFSRPPWRASSNRDKIEFTICSPKST